MNTNLSVKVPDIVGDNDMRDLVVRFFEEVLAGKSDLTIKAVKEDLKKFLLFYQSLNGHLNASHWMLRDSKLFRDELEKQKYAYSTINRTMSSVRSFGIFLRDIGILQLNPTRGIKEFHLGEFQPKWIDDRSFHRLLKVADLRVTQPQKRYSQAHRDRAFLVCLDGSGLRVNELCQLQISQWDGRRRMRRVKCKGGRLRNVLLTIEAARLLEDYLSNHRVCGSDYLFTTRNGNRLYRSNIDEALKKVAAQANINLPEEEKINFSCHKVRHRVAMKSRNKSLLLAQRRLGLASLRQLSRYGALSQPEEEKMIEEL